jgi:hypothetical protein
MLQQDVTYLIKRVTLLEEKLEKVMLILNVMESEVENPNYPPPAQIGALNEAY